MKCLNCKRELKETSSYIEDVGLTRHKFDINENSLEIICIYCYNKGITFENIKKEGLKENGK